MGQLIYERSFCTSCHWQQGSKPPSFNFMSAVFSKGLEEHPDYYFWTVSEGRGSMLNMLPLKRILPPKQRWQVINYLWSMGKEWEKEHAY